MIRIQTEDFDKLELYKALSNTKGSGAIVEFTGLVRDFNQVGSIDGLYLEHYPEMTEQALKNIRQRAMERWQDLRDIFIIHRVGELLNDAQIVYVGVASEHRKAAFEAAQFVMDYLKNEAPFWKKERCRHHEDRWVEQKQTDREALQRWSES